MPDLAPVQQFEHHARGHHALLDPRLVDSGQPGPAIRSIGYVVETDDAHIVGNGQSEPFACRVGAEGHDIRHGHDRGRTIVFIPEPLECGTFATATRTLHLFARQPDALNGKRSFGDHVPETLHSCRADEGEMLVHRAENIRFESEHEYVPVTEIEHIPHELSGGPAVVDTDVRGRFGWVTVDGDEGNMPAMEQFHHFVIRVHAQGQYAVDEGPSGGFDDPAPHGRKHRERNFPCFAGRSDPADDLAEIGIAERFLDLLRKQEAQGTESLGGERPRHRVRNVPEFLDDPEYPLAGFGGDAPGTVEGEGDGRLRDARPVGNILYGNPHRRSRDAVYPLKVNRSTSESERRDNARQLRRNAVC